MLLNAVKLRYGDSPFFLEVTSVINQYSLETDLRVNALDFTSPADNNTFNFSKLGVGGGAKWADRPTISYSPLLGEKFSRSLMTPVSPTALLYLIHADYPVDLILLTCTTSINGLHNRAGAKILARKGTQDFFRVIKLLRENQRAGLVSARLRRLEKKRILTLLLRQTDDPKLLANARECKKLLGLEAEAAEFRVVYGGRAGSTRELAILTRSMLEIIIELAAHIDVPSKHLAEGRAAKVLPVEEAQRLIRIHSSNSRPADAFVSVAYRGHWFWIDDCDLHSKRMFTFLMLLFSLVESPEGAGGPVVTIPAG